MSSASTSGTSSPTKKAGTPTPSPRSSTKPTWRPQTPRASSTDQRSLVVNVAGVIGSPVAHSLSPAIHNAAFRAGGADWVYVAFEVAPGQAGAALDAVRVLGVRGLSVTTPHKEAVA